MLITHQRERRTSWTRGKDNSDEISSKRSSAADKSPEKSPEHIRKLGRVEEPKIDTELLTQMLSTVGTDELTNSEEEEEEEKEKEEESVLGAKPAVQTSNHKKLLQDPASKLKTKSVSILDQNGNAPSRPHENGNLNDNGYEDAKGRRDDHP